MPAARIFWTLGLIVAAAGLGGCASTANTTKPQLAETASLAGADAGYALALPDTVSVLPESAFAAAAPNADLAALPSPMQPGGEPAAQPVVVASAEPGFVPASYAAPSSPSEAGPGVVDRLTVLDFKDLPKGKTKVTRFDLAGTDCGKISRVLVNSATQCEGTGVDPNACTRQLKTETKAKIAFGV